MAAKELHHLLRVLDERDIPLGRDDVAWAFDSPHTQEATTSWIREYLTPIGLLTKEELNFHEKRPSTFSGPPSTALASRPLSDADFEAAISSLEQSTQAIEEQCQVLEAQRKALQHLTTHESALRDSKQAKQKKLARDKAQLDFELNKLSDSLQTRLTTSSKHCDTSAATISNNIARILEKDDKLLDGLQKLLPNLSPDPDQDAHLSAEIDRLCNTLTTLTIQDIRARMDTAFTPTHTTTTTTTTDIDKKLEKQRLSLRAELSELCNEIDSLATMAIDTQFRRPLRVALTTSQSDSDDTRARWTTYATNTLHYLTTRLEALTAHSSHLHAHQNALRQTAASLEETLLRPPHPSPRDSHPLPTRALTTPTSKGLKPLRLVQAHSEQDPVTQTLRHFAITGVADPTDTPAFTALLDETLRSRALELRDLQTATARAVSDALAEHLAKGDRDLEALVRAVYVFSRYAGVRLVDGGVEELVAGLERETERVGALVRGLDVEGVGREVRRGLARVTGG